MTTNNSLRTAAILTAALMTQSVGASERLDTPAPSTVRGSCWPTLITGTDGKDVMNVTCSFSEQRAADGAVQDYYGWNGLPGKAISTNNGAANFISINSGDNRSAVFAAITGDGAETEICLGSATIPPESLWSGKVEKPVFSPAVCDSLLNVVNNYPGDYLGEVPNPAKSAKIAFVGGGDNPHVIIALPYQPSTTECKGYFDVNAIYAKETGVLKSKEFTGGCRAQEMESNGNEISIVHSVQHGHSSTHFYGLDANSEVVEKMRAGVGVRINPLLNTPNM